jgi:hypothetical protein
MQSESVKSLAAALAAAQAEMPSVLMNAVNPFLKNKFADLGAVIETSRPVLAKHRLSVTQFPISDGDRIGVTTTLMHESGEWISQSVSLPLSDEKGKSAAQVAGSIITYLRRYSWSSVLGLYADEDTDGSHPRQAQEAEKQKVSTERVMKELGYPPETPAPANGNGHKQIERPISASTLRSFIAKKATTYAERKAAASDADRKIVASALDKIFGGEKNKTARYEVCKWLVNESSTKKMGAPTVKALMDWLECHEFDDNPPAYVVTEAQAAHTAALQSAGQQKLGV